MALRASRSAARYLTLEVWLGPMEGLRHAVEAEGSPAVVRIGRRRADEKKGLRNDFVLAEGEGISGFHAELRYDGEALFLKDLKSTNGTFWKNRPVTGEVEIRPGEVFLLSTTPVRVDLAEEPRAEPPPAPAADEDPAGFPPARRLLEGARAVAQRRGENYIDTRHLCEALLSAKDPRVEKAFRDAGFPPAKALAELWADGLFRGPLEWLRRFLKAPIDARAPESPLPLSPKVQGCLALARVRLAEFSSDEATARLPAGLLAMLLQNTQGAVGAWLRERGVELSLPARETQGTTVRKTVRTPRPSRVTRVPGDETTVPTQPVRADETTPRPAPVSVMRAAPAPSPPPPVPRQPAPAAQPPLTTGDASLDARAREIAAEIEEAATLYRFSTPEDRRSVLKTLVARSLSAIAPENRAKILEQIRIQFPVLEATAASADEVDRLTARIRELEQKIAAVRADGEASRTAAPSPARGAAAKGSFEGRRPGGAAEEPLWEAVEFARNIERFLLGLIQSVTMPGSTTSSFRLSSYRYTLSSFLKAAEQGKDVDRQAMSDYLRELERWHVAILAAHHESPKLWFERLWKRVSPAAIEASPKGASWKMRGDSAEWWNRYKEAVQGLNPEVVQDQVLQTAYRFAREEFDKLSKRRQQ